MVAEAQVHKGEGEIEGSIPHLSVHCDAVALDTADNMYCETEWTLTSRSDTHGVSQAYVRPLLGSELFVDQFALVFDGLLECCIGISIHSSFPQDVLQEKLKYALARLRFFTPLVGSTIESQSDQHPLFRSWVYSPVQSQEELDRWVAETFVLVNEPMDASSFIRRMYSQRVPYVLPDGRLQYFRLYMVRLDSGENDFGIFFHGSHSIMDAKPTVRVLSKLLEWVTDAAPLPLSDLAWDWEASYAALSQTIRRIYSLPTPTISLAYKSPTITDPGQQRLVRMKLSTSETAAVSATLKTLGLSITHLIHAAVALAVFDLADSSTEAEGEEAHLTFQNCVISLERYFTQLPYELKQHYVSAFGLVAVTIPRHAVFSAASDDDSRARLIATSKLVKAQLDSYLAEPCMPHLAALQHSPGQAVNPVSMPNPYAVEVTNVGNVDKDLPVLWPVGDDLAPMIRVSDMHVGVRITLLGLMVHTWTMQSQFNLQIQGGDHWDVAMLENFLRAVVRQMLLLCGPEASE
ncbi:hypothetical protein BD414DRAFT_504085 [Trametes punicea]|nr:hypothetical protein BD414DRAFT_504103 [Trametes punicea]KAI8968671.1 hypothetical protein BD414DRAFT_504085 [Trametes punicea]